jgi:nucleoid-associated protein YgaU
LEQELAQRSSDSDALKAKLSAEETALKASSDTQTKAEDSAAELSRIRGELASTKAQLADAVQRADSARTATGDTAALQRQVTDLSDRLAGSLRSYAVLQQENASLRRSSPQRPSAVAAARPAPAPAPAPTPVPVRTHVVVDGDTLTKISREYYGTSARWPEIYQANRDVMPNESSLSVGAVLRIP